MTHPEKPQILPLIWLCLFLLLVPVALRVVYAVRLTRGESRTGPLERAVLRGDLPALRVLLDHGADPNTRLEGPSVPSVSLPAVWHNVLHGAPGGATPILTLAAEDDAAPVVQLLLERGADANVRDDMGETPLSTVAREGAGPPGAEPDPRGVAIMRLLLTHGARVNAHEPDGETPLFRALESQNVPGVKLLLEHGAPANGRGIEGETPLERAERDADVFPSETLPLVRLLLDHGADPNQQTSSQKSVLVTAASLHDWGAVSLLLDHGADPNGSMPSPLNSSTPLMESIADGRMDVFRRLLARGADVNAHSSYFGDPLGIAAQNGRTEMVKTLLERGAEPNYSGDDEMSAPALVCAARRGDAKLAALLLDHGADPNLKDAEGDTPLIANADADLWDDYARRHKSADGSSTVDLSDIAGLRPTTRPVHTDAAQALISHGADINARNNVGITALKFARIGGKAALARLLLAHGAQE